MGGNLQTVTPPMWSTSTHGHYNDMQIRDNYVIGFPIFKIKLSLPQTSTLPVNCVNCIVLHFFHIINYGVTDAKSWRVY